jgi:hypothetical protein
VIHEQAVEVTKEKHRDLPPLVLYTIPSRLKKIPIFVAVSHAEEPAL